MNDQLKNVMIALFVIAACMIAVFIIVFLHPSTGDEGQTVRVRFTDIDKISVGTRVTFGGKPVGEVVEIIPLEDQKRRHSKNEEAVYIYELVLKLDSGVDLFTTDEIFARTSGLLGEKSVAIVPRPIPVDQKPIPIDSRVLYAKETGSMEQTFKEIKEAAGKLGGTLEQIATLLEEAKDEKIVKGISTIIKNIEGITSSLNCSDSLRKTIDNVYTVTNEIRCSWPKVDASLNDINAITATSRSLVDEVCAGKGSIGKLLADDDFYLRMASVLNKAEVIADDVNHYGLLFHLDKSWQRLRARRMNLLSTLSTPQEFRNYFNDELDRVHTSLSRVAMILDSCGGPCSCPDLAFDPQFNKVFAELLRRVEGLEDDLNLYNSQLNEPRVNLTELSPCQ